jgi:hypothetical protein
MIIMNIEAVTTSPPLGSMDKGLASLRRASSMWIGVLLFLLVFAVFSPSLSYELVAVDDIHYISHNQLVLGGLSWSAIRVAFTDFYNQMYAPLLWISYMADVSFGGASPVQPWGFHLTNVLLHSLNSLLLYFLLLAWCKKPWRAFFFAALWALHPLRVESVAWVTERKDVLSGLFALLCLGCYWRANRHKAIPAIGPTLLALVFFIAGLLVKPSLTPIPLVLLLLDYWPLRRYGPNAPPLLRAAPRLLLEKTPFFLASFALQDIPAAQPLPAVCPSRLYLVRLLPRLRAAGAALYLALAAAAAAAAWVGGLAVVSWAAAARQRTDPIWCPSGGRSLHLSPDHRLVHRGAFLAPHLFCTFPPTKRTCVAARPVGGGSAARADRPNVARPAHLEKQPTTHCPPLRLRSPTSAGTH